MEFNEVPESTRKVEYAQTLGNPSDYVVAAGTDKLMKLNQKEFEKLVQNDFDSTMDELNADMKFDAEPFRAYQNKEYDDDDDIDTHSMCSTYSKYKPAFTSSFMVPRQTHHSKNSANTKENIQSMYQEFNQKTQ